MRFALMTEPQQGLSYDQIVVAARHAETAGFEAFFRSDHYGSFPGRKDHPTTDAWTTLAGVARETERIRLGTLVSPVTFRHPGSLAKVAGTVDEMSGGRVEVGVGSGWNRGEHAQLGLRFPALGERFDMLEEELEILHGLWREPDGWSFDGRHWQVRDSLLRPKPVQQPHPPIILGGTGKPRSIRLAARWADEYNLQGVPPADIPPHHAALEQAVAEAGRPPGSVVLSAMIGVLVAADDVELDARLTRLMGVFELAPADADKWLALRRPSYLMGTPDEVLKRVRDYEAAGLERMILQDWLPTDLDMLSLIGREVLPYA